MSDERTIYRPVEDGRRLVDQLLTRQPITEDLGCDGDTGPWFVLAVESPWLGNDRDKVRVKLLRAPPPAPPTMAQLQAALAANVARAGAVSARIACLEADLADATDELLQRFRCAALQGAMAFPLAAEATARLAEDAAQAMLRIATGRGEPEAGEEGESGQVARAEVAPGHPFL